MKVKKTIISQILILALLIINVCLLMACKSNKNSIENKEPQSNFREDPGTEPSEDEIPKLMQDRTLSELLCENIDQSILEYGGSWYRNNSGVVEYRLYVVSDSNEELAEEIRNVYAVMENFLLSDAYEGEAISIVILAESVHCHAYNILAIIENSDYSYNYYGKKDNIIIEDHVSYIEPYGIDDETEFYDENIDYVINQESYWNSFDVDYVEFDYFNRE